MEPQTLQKLLLLGLVAGPLFGYFVVLPLLKKIDMGGFTREKVAEIALMTGGRPVATTARAELYRIEGGREIPWILEGLSHHRRGEGFGHRAKQGLTVWRTAAAGSRDNWFALMAPVGDNFSAAAFDNPLMRKAMTFLLGEEVGGEFARATLLPLAPPLERAFIAAARNPHPVQPWLAGAARPVLEQWAVRGPGHPKVLIIFDARGIELSYMYGETDPAVLAELARLGEGLARLVPFNP